MREEKVILVDENDNEIGTETKILAHQRGQCHRAFSVFIFHRNQNEIKLLLQQRQKDKYHSGGLWTNTCCSHPRPGENIILAGERRLKEEMGMEIKLALAGHFHYRAECENGLIENEYDHVLVGFAPVDDIHFNPTEVAAVRWITMTDLFNALENHPKQFTVWFKQALFIATQHLL